jgi:hypothetical protein
VVWKEEQMRIALCLLLAAWSAACLSPEPPGGDVDPPVVMSVSPAGDWVEPDAEVVVTFTEPVADAVRDECLLVLVPADRADDAFLRDFDSPPLISSRAAQVLACTYRTDMDGGRIFLRPDGLLEFDRDSAVVVSAAVTDRAGNPLVDSLATDERGRSLGQQTHLVHTFRTRPAPVLPGPTGPVFSEVLANPSGTESAGEYVELIHLGDTGLDLSGFTLDDSGGEGAGDVLGPCAEGGSALLAPGAVALLVGRNFTAPPDLLPGTLLLCTDRSTVTPRGLKNGGGEVLVLRDTDGREVDRYGGWVNLSSHEDCAALKLDLTAPDGPDNWAVAAGEPCRSPGWVE